MALFETIKEPKGRKEEIKPDDFIGSHWDKDFGGNFAEESKEEVEGSLANPFKEMDKKKERSIPKCREILSLNPLEKVKEEEIEKLINKAFPQESKGDYKEIREDPETAVITDKELDEFKEKLKKRRETQAEV